MRHENNRVALLRHVKSNSCGNSQSIRETAGDTGGGRSSASGNICTKRLKASACNSCGALQTVNVTVSPETDNQFSKPRTYSQSSGVGAKPPPPPLKNFRSKSLQNYPETQPPDEIVLTKERGRPSLSGPSGGGGNSAKGAEGRAGSRDLQKVITLWQNYYPEGQWGWIIVSSAIIVQCIAHGSQLAYSVLAVQVERKFHVHNPLQLGLLGSFSMLISQLLSPLWIALCKRKSTRLVGIFGGLLAALGCLFTSFATQFHQLFVSYGIFLGVGVGFSRDASLLMVGQYFKRKRNLVEIFVVAGSGAGIVTMSISIHLGIRLLSWRLGLQAVTVCLLSVFFLGVLYRSASLYHPQRRAILHIKNQRRKVKEKYKREDSLPLVDWSCLKSKTLRILLVSSTVTCLGIHTPLFYMGWKCKAMKVDDMSMLLLHIYIGVAWVMSCLLFGILVTQSSVDCRLSKQYLCQGSGIFCGLSIIGLAVVQELSGLTVFAWVYGFSAGAYEYTIKVYTFDRARARNFPWAWSILRSCQGLSTFLGTCLTGRYYFLKVKNVFLLTRGHCQESAAQPTVTICIAEPIRKDYLFERGTALSAGKMSLAFCISSGVAVFGALLLFFADFRRRKLRAKGQLSESFKATTAEPLCSKSLAFVLASELNDAERTKAESGGEIIPSQESSVFGKKFSAASIAEELAGIDLQDIYFEDWELMLGGDAITSCNKVENCLASEAESSYTLAPTFERRSSTKYKGGRFSAIDGISGPAIRVATGVVGIRTPDQRHHLCRIAESESFSSPSYSEDGSVPKIEFAEMEIPSFDTLQKKKKHSKNMDESSA